MRALAVDFGERRVGLAVSDESGTLVVPVGVVQRTSDAQVVREVILAAEERAVVRIVVGHPVREDGAEGPMALRTRSFARKLAAATPVSVVLFGEANTTTAAEAGLLEAGVPAARRAAARDAEAAAILLRDYLSLLQVPKAPTAGEAP